MDEKPEIVGRWIDHGIHGWIEGYVLDLCPRCLVLVVAVPDVSPRPAQSERIPQPDRKGISWFVDEIPIIML